MIFFSLLFFLFASSIALTDFILINTVVWLLYRQHVPGNNNKLSTIEIGTGSSKRWAVNRAGWAGKRFFI